MNTHLRPMSLGEILDRTAQLYRSNFLLFAGIASVYAGSLMALGLAHIGVQELFKAWHWTNQLLLLAGASLVVQFVVSFVLGGVAVGANNRAVAWAHLGQKATIRDAYRSVLPRFGSFVWLMTIMTFVLWTPLGIGYGCFAGLMYWYTMHTKNGVHPDQGTTVLFGLLFLGVLAVLFVGFVYGVLMGLRYALAIPVWVVEETKARAAIRRSIELSQGSRGRIFMLGLLVATIEIVLVGVSQSFFIFLAFKNRMVLPTWAMVAQQLVGFATSSFILPMYGTGITLFYYDQRVRKEGFDIEWMMQAAGLDAVVAPAGLPVSSGPVREIVEAPQIEPHGEQP